MGKRVSHSALDPWLTMPLKSLYPRLPIPRAFPPEGIVVGGHAVAALAGVGFAWSTTVWWGGLLAAGGVAANHVADCLDGTHARATNQCRNGGELLDHFFDPLSFSYWLAGIAVSIERLDLGIVAVICLYATAVLTNIKAKLIGEFTLARFGPTEFKTLLVLFGLLLSALTLRASAETAAEAASWFFAVLLLVGIGQLLWQLIAGVVRVNRDGSEPDTTEWESR